MPKKIFSKGEELTAAYTKRLLTTEMRMLTATMNLVAYYMGLGDDLATANDKVDQVSHAVLQTHAYGSGRI